MQPTLHYVFLILCNLRLIILLFRFLFYVAVLYLLSVFLASNMSCNSSFFDVNVSCIVNTYSLFLAPLSRKRPLLISASLKSKIIL